MNPKVEVSEMIPVELQASVPRDVTWTAAGRGFLGIALLMAVGTVVLAVGLSIVVAREAALAQRMNAEGIVVQGTVLQQYQTRSKNPKTVFTYEYRVGEIAYRGDAQAPGRWAPRFQTGSAVPVRYLASSPEISQAEGLPRRRFPAGLIPVVTALCLAGSWAVFWLLRRERELLSHGRAVLAHVVDEKSGSPRPGPAATKLAGKNRICVQFRLLSGSAHQVALAYAKETPAPGSPVVILYAPDNPNRVLRYPSAVVCVRAAKA